MRCRRPVVPLLSLLVALACVAPPAAGEAQAQAAPYRDLLARVQAGDTTVDFTALRMARVASTEYAPYGSAAVAAHRDSIDAALERQDFGRALAEADSTLGLDYLDIRAHWLKAYASAQVGDTAAEDWHLAIAAGLLGSIRASGTGTEQAPYVVISIAEEYAVLSVNGFKHTLQVLRSCGARPCDMFRATHQKSGEQHTFYFDVSLLKAHFYRQLEKQ